MRRPSRPVVYLCVAVIVLAALLPGSSALDYALFEPHWILLPDDAPVVVCHTGTPGREQPASLLSLLPSRAPPSLPLA